MVKKWVAKKQQPEVEVTAISDPKKQQPEVEEAVTSEKLSEVNMEPTKMQQSEVNVAQVPNAGCSKPVENNVSDPINKQATTADHTVRGDVHASTVDSTIKRGSANVNVTSSDPTDSSNINSSESLSELTEQDEVADDLHISPEKMKSKNGKDKEAIISSGPGKRKSSNKVTGIYIKG